jgi:DNA-binding transcriptional ArsR family regulator
LFEKSGTGGSVTRTDEVRAVLQALADEVRLEMVGRLAAADEDLVCAALYDDLPRSTASYHFQILRTSGVIEQYDAGGRRYNRLRRPELEQLAPGLLDAVLTAVSDGPTTPD